MSSATRPTATAVQTFVSAAQTDLPKAVRDRFGTTSVQDTQLSSAHLNAGAVWVADYTFVAHADHERTCYPAPGGIDSQAR